MRSLVLLAAAFAALLPVARAAGEPEPLIARLAPSVAPEAYDISLTLRPAAATVEGSETIDLRVDRESETIRLNAADLTVSGASVDGAPAAVETLPAIEQIRLRPAVPIARGTHRLSLAFRARIHDAMQVQGLFTSTGGSVVSLFEPSTARMLFPCFDEPAFRAAFSLHVTAPKEWTVVSNMPLESRATVDGLQARNDFLTSPPLSTYMLTLAAGPFHDVEDASGRVPVRVYFREGSEAKARVVVADAGRFLRYYERFFGTPYPFPKLDLVVDGGVLQSAFEGPGSILYYSEYSIFGSQFGGGTAGRRHAVQLVAHEMAHQWVGDLVTMRWWRDTFVSEGVAQYAERVAVRTLYPELDSALDDDASVAAVMRRPVGPETSPVVSDTPTDLEKDANVPFDLATYEKGASVLEGWGRIAGEATLRRGLQRFLRRFQFGSATFEDFWRAVGGAQGLAYGRAWLTRPGFPVISVDAACHAGHETVRLAQQAFVADPRVGEAYRSQVWPVPTLVSVGAQDRPVLLKGRSADLEFAGCGSVVLDRGLGPYHIVRYAERIYTDLARRLRALNRRDRERILRDAIALHGADQLSNKPFVSLIGALPAVTSMDIVRSGARDLWRLNGDARGSPAAEILLAAEHRAFYPRLQRVLIPKAAADYSAVDAAIALDGLDDREAGRLFKALAPGFIRNGSPALPGNFGFMIPALGSIVATSADIDAVFDAAREMEHDDYRRAGVLRFLEGVGDEILAAGTLRRAIADPRIGGDEPLAFVIGLGKRHPRLAFDYLSTHLDDLWRPLSAKERAEHLSSVTSVLWPAASPSEFEALFKRMLPDDPNGVLAALNHIRAARLRRRALERSLSLTSRPD